MALAHLALSLPLRGCCSCRNGGLIEQPGIPLGLGYAAARSSTGNGGAGAGGRGLKSVVTGVGLGSGNRGVLSRGKLKVEDAPVDAQVRSSVEIPVTCYRIIGVTEQAEKDEIVKSVMELKGSEIEDGYTMDVILSRQDLLMDVRDKLLFEPEYAGNSREKIPPKSSLRIPWAWLPGALCLLQEVGEEKLVLDIGQAALQHQDAKPYSHDLLLSMALAECSIAKASFEKNKVSQGFEALARAQYLLRSKTSLENMPLLSQIEESLEELAPACTLEILSMPLTPDNADRRPGAIAAMRELLRQGLEVEASCRVQDWSTFLNQTLSKLMASEIVDLLPWDGLAITRKNKKSLESQNQRIVIDFNCFYLVMIAHIALGFSRRQTDLISKAKTICECLMASEGVDLKFEDGICSFLLGQDAKTITTEKLHQLEINGSHVSGNSKLSVNKDPRGSTDFKQSLEMFLKDAVLDVFPDTRGGSPSLANFYGGQKKLLSSNKQIESAKTTSRVGVRSATFNLSHDNRSKEVPQLNSTVHLGGAVKQLAPVNLHAQPTASKGGGSANASSTQLKRELGMHQKKFWEVWWAARGLTNRIAQVAVVGFVAFSSFMLYMQFWQRRIPYSLKSSNPNMKMGNIAWTMCCSSDHSKGPTFIGRKNIGRSLGDMLVTFSKQLKNPSLAGTTKNTWPADECSNSGGAGSLMHKRQMPLEEAEALVKQWQTVKAEALGPKHKAPVLSEVLSEPMLSQWQDLADAAKAKSCFWRFVLLQMSILQAEIISDGGGEERAEIEAMLEEAAELVDESQQKNPSYYSTYKMRYLLKRQFDGSWKFCGGDIQTPA